MLLNHVRAQVAFEEAKGKVAQWARRPDDQLIVFTTLTGSAYVIQSSEGPDGPDWVLRQLEGDSLQEMFGTLGGMFPRVQRAYTEVATRRARFVVTPMGWDKVAGVMTSPVAFVQDCGGFR